jgi:hypothetical protein
MHLSANSGKALLRSSLLHVPTLALLIFAVGLFNGRPTIFADTTFYYSQGEYLASALGYPHAPLTAAERADPYSVMPGSIGVDHKGAVAIAAARSPIYGVFLYLCQQLGGLWLLVGMQALAVAWILFMFVRAAAPAGGLRLYYGVGAVLVFGSSLPFFTAFVMPDAFAGVAILCAVMIVIWPDRLSRIEHMGGWCLLTFGVAIHKSNLLTLVGLIAISAVVLALSHQPYRQIFDRCGALALSAMVAVGASMVCGAIYLHDTGLRQSAPPFLMARVLADGPGRAYLDAYCPNGAGPTLCRFKGQGFTSQEEFIWSTKPDVGVYSVVDYGTKQRLKREEPGFVLHAVAYRPVMELEAATKNALTQLTLFTAVEPFHDPTEFLSLPRWSTTSAWRIGPGNAACAARPTRCSLRLPVKPLQIWQGLVLLLSLAILVVAAASSRIRRAIIHEAPSSKRAETLLALKALGLVLAAVILNAGVCGVISGPFPRYEARLIWLLPLVSVLLLRILPWRWLWPRARSKAAG